MQRSETSNDTSMTRTGSLQFLFAIHQGGGNIALILPIVGRLVARGHRVSVLAGPGIWPTRVPVSARLRERIAALGATLVPFQEPTIHPLDAAPPLRGLLRGWTPRRIAATTSRVHAYRWAPVWATNVTAELRREPTDLLAVDFLLAGALAAGEATGIVTAALVHAPGLPPLGGAAAQGPLEAIQNALEMAASKRVLQRDGLPPLNRARQQLGLSPLRSAFDQDDRADRVLFLINALFDFPARRLQPNVRYVGTPFDDVGAAPWASPWPSADARPLVLVSLSTLAQGQGPVMERILAALAPLPVRALVTLGPSLDPAQFHPPENAKLERFVPHSAVLPQVAAMVTQCGLSTVIKALAHGVPLVCIPLRADQPGNAARVVARGAGIRLRPNASPDQIAQGIRQVLTEPRYRAMAQRFAATVAGEDGAQNAAQELEAAAGFKRPGSE